MTSLAGVYSVSNALHVHDLVDYVSETAETAGKALAAPQSARQLADIQQQGFLYLVPQKLDLSSLQAKTTFYFRTAQPRTAAKLTVSVDDKVVFTKRFAYLKPPEMEKVDIPLHPTKGQSILFNLETMGDE